MSQKLKVVTIGGGSSYTPELLEGFIKRYHELPVSELWLVDVEGGKAKLDIIFDLCQRMIDNAGVPMKLYKTLDRREALKDADFVTTQLRVGQLPARELDERIPLSHGYLGQETNGAGGLFKGLRTIPVIFDIVKDVEELCPNAWVINFTNPAGMVTEAVYRHTGFKRFIGVCNIPIGMKMFIRDVLMLKDSDDLSIDLFGLNHMVFIKDVLVNGKSRFAELLDGVASGQLKASGVKNIFDLPFSEGLIRSLNLLPCSYLLYYFKQKEMLAIEMGEYYKGGARAQVVQKVEKQLFELYKNPELKVKPKELEQRGGAYYSDAACEVINAIYNDKQAEHYVNIPHHGHIDNIPADWAVEMTCTLGRDGATPHPRITHFDDKVMGLIHTIKGFEIAASNAALSGEFNDVLLALNLSPLVHSDRDAELLAREMILAHEKWLPNFADCIAELKKAHQPRLIMERLLIVNADDFGLSKGQNYGIIEACRNGIVTSTTALVNGQAIDHAVQLSRDEPSLAIGMHFVLTMGKPLTAMPGLTRDGVLGKWIWQLAEEDALPLEEITQELASQYLRFIELFGRKPTHLDSHHHVHMFPQIFPIVAKFAAEEGIALRIDRQSLSKDGDLPANLRSSQGFSSAFYGEEISETLFLQVLDDSSHRGERSLEVMCHPAFIDNTIRQSAYCFPRLTELDVLTSASLKYAIAERGYRLGSYHDV